MSQKKNKDNKRESYCMQIDYLSNTQTSYYSDLYIVRNSNQIKFKDDSNRIGSDISFTIS